MKRIMNFLTCSCKTATKLIEKKSVSILSLKESLQLKFHTLMCNTCNSYEKQSKNIDQALSKWMKNNQKNKIQLSEKSKLDIIKKMKES
ncbi:MAG TPA: hypothetical protein ENK52_05750 [Saprospiraceae bacterium]|nr:hypothetical protein [Saprospiraceae bacterium]